MLYSLHILIFILATAVKFLMLSVRVHELWFEMGSFWVMDWSFEKKGYSIIRMNGKAIVRFLFESNRYYSCL